MRTLAMMTAGLVFPALGQTVANAGLAQVKTVYVLPMGSGLDQYLANQITRRNLFQVMTEAANVDAVLTDQIGAGFTQKMEELFPAAKPEKQDEDKKKEESKEGLAGEGVAVPKISTFQRGRGMVFVVERRTGRVIWSTYERARSGSPDDLNRAALRTVERLSRDARGK
jgi:hypothetical protein